MKFDIRYGESEQEEAEYNRLLIFFTVAGLIWLCQSHLVSCDGTFKAAPSLFYQLYTIHGQIGTYMYPFVCTYQTHISNCGPTLFVKYIFIQTLA